TDVKSEWTRNEQAAAPTATPAPAPAPQVEAPPTPPPAPVIAAPPAPPPTPAPRGLAPAPDSALVEASPIGPLPKIGPDGRQPWQVYARPFNAPDNKPLVAVLVTGLGLSSATTEAAIAKLPPEITLSFSPYAEKLGDWLTAARAAGHEAL